MKTIFLITGTSSSGKTTLAKRIQQTLGYEYFGLDDELARLTMAAFCKRPTGDTHCWHTLFREHAEHAAWLVTTAWVNNILASLESVNNAVVEGIIPVPMEECKPVYINLFAECACRVIPIVLSGGEERVKMYRETLPVYADRPTDLDTIRAANAEYSAQLFMWTKLLWNSICGDYTKDQIYTDAVALLRGEIE